mgnify:FL=1|tara:strand:- start:2495 stop:4420 length:1926 start_codon:yes stop_codon:yes gene_type:complete
MQFLHPEYFYALPALLIPIFIHLFQLRRFKKYAFTNVALLQKLRFQTRKSSQIKKWLVLILRLLAIACIILAFTHPYFSNQKATDNTSETVIYLDNSFSMQALGANGPLLKRGIQDVIDGIEETKKISVFTNENSYESITLKNLKNKLLNISYSQDQLSLNNVILKGTSLFSNSKSSLKTLLVASDFQKHNQNLLTVIDTTIKVVFVPLKPLNTANDYIDTISIESSLNSNTEINVTAKTNDKNKDSIAVTLFEGNKKIGKSILEKAKGYQTSFEVQTKKGFKGKFSIEDSQMYYDDNFYFSIPKTSKISVLAINDQTSATFLSKIYTKDEFVFKNQDYKTLDFSEIKNNNLIVLNGINNISLALKNSLKDFMNSGGIVLMIPGSKGDVLSYNQLISTQTKHSLKPLKLQEKSITGIEFNHTVLKDVFKTKVSNFQYPSVKSYYTVTASSNKILTFEDQQAFLSQFNSLFVFTASLDAVNSNFKNSPLIVPTLYNIGRLSLRNLPLQYWTGEKNTFDLKVNLQKDHILKLSRNKEEFIPLQSNFNSKVQITTDEMPNEPGHYAVLKNSDTITHISYNYNRKESLLIYDNLLDIEGVIINNSLNIALKNINSEANVMRLWKWFIIFALILLAFEMLILKYFK